MKGWGTLQGIPTLSFASGARKDGAPFKNWKLKNLFVYSQRRAMAGSTREARRAGR
jgi:hypothetical protein